MPIMLKRLAPLIALVTGAALLVLPAHAGSTRTVDMSLSGNVPKTATVLQGTTVHWNNVDTIWTHTSTSDQGFWKSPLIEPGQTYDQTDAFLNAGTYGYHCTQHPTLVGTVRVPLTWTGSSTTGWKIIWSSAPTLPANRKFDVQVKKPGSSSFDAFKTGTTTLSAKFNPAKSGKYVFRARTRNTSNGKPSDWSPTHTFTIS